MFYPISSGPPQHMPPYAPASSSRAIAGKRAGRLRAMTPPKVWFGPRPRFKFRFEAGWQRGPLVGPYFDVEPGDPERRRRLIRKLRRISKAAALCMVIFHAPDGSNLWLEAESINAIRPGAAHHDHIAARINSVVTSVGKSYGVRETPEEAARMIKQCE